MKSVKLNKHIRERIILDIKTKFLSEYTKKNGFADMSALDAVIESKTKELGISLWIDIYKLETISELQKIPKALLSVSRCLAVNVFDGPYVSINLPEQYICSRNVDVQIEKNKWEDIKENFGLSKLERLREKANDKANEFIPQVVGILDSVSTTKQLIELWPEVKEFIPSDALDPSTIRLPAICTASLNSKLSLGDDN